MASRYHWTLGLSDALQVVADAHVEDHPRARAGPAQLVVQGVDQDPGPQILVEGLVDLELLRPLDVVPLVGDVDAGLVDVELVEGLDGLELDQPGTHQPGGDDVLGHLGVGPAATPNGVSISTPYSRRRNRWSGRGTKKADRGTLKSESFCSSSVKVQSVSCSIEMG